MKQTAHTPGQLEIHLCEECVIIDKHGARVADVLRSYYDDPALKAANAARLVLAWNCHDDMLEALKAVRSQYALFVYPTTDDIARETLVRVDAAIAKAEGQS